MSAVLEHNAVDAGRHVVQFYARDADLVAGAGGYLRDALRSGAAAIVIARGARRAALEAHLRDAGIDVEAARAEGRLVALDAAATLARFMRDGRVDPGAFLEVVGPTVRAAARTGRRVCAYGEMVALLWEGGDVPGAIDLETAWNELAAELPLSVYCGYRHASVAGDGHAAARDHVCRLHTAVVPATPAAMTWRFEAVAAAPGAARRRVADALAAAGYAGELLDDVRLVIAELAANAVVHARSPFSVSLEPAEARLRIVVRDGSRREPAIPEDSATRTSGRGLRLVAALADRWGVDLAPDGKAVWAELGGGPG